MNSTETALATQASGSDLNVRGMLRGHSLARVLSDASLGEFRSRVQSRVAFADRFFPFNENMLRMWFGEGCCAERTHVQLQRMSKFNGRYQPETTIYR